MNTIVKTIVSEDALKVVGMTPEKLGDESIIEVLVSDISNVRNMLDKRFVGRLIMGQKQWSRGDLLVAGVALQLAYAKSDEEGKDLVKFAKVNRGTLAAALAGQWKNGNPFRLTTSSATEVLDALKSAEESRKNVEKIQRRREHQATVKAARQEIARLDAEGVDLFLGNWGEAIKANTPWVLEVFEAARTGVWAASGEKFVWDGRNTTRVESALKRLNESWDRALRLSASNA